MPDKELSDTLRTIIKEELQPVWQEIKHLNLEVKNLNQEMKQANTRLGKLEKGQKEIKTELRGAWEDIKRLDKRLITQEQRNAL